MRLTRQKSKKLTSKKVSPYLEKLRSEDSMHFAIRSCKKFALINANQYIWWTQAEKYSAKRIKFNSKTLMYQITGIIQINLDHCIRECCRVQWSGNIPFAGLNPRTTAITLFRKTIHRKENMLRQQLSNEIHKLTRGTFVERIIAPRAIRTCGKKGINNKDSKLLK